MSCEPFRDDLILLLEPELDADPDPALREHAWSCLRCQEELVRLTLALSEQPAPAPPPLPSLPAREGAAEGLPPAPRRAYRRSARASALAAELRERRVAAASEEAAAGPLEAGQSVGPYRIVDELVRGGVGIVYRALAPDGREVALRVDLVAEGRAAEQRLERIRARAAEVARVADPRLVGVLDLGLLTHGEGCWGYVVLPLLTGPSLGDLLEQGRCEPQEATEIVAETSRALRAAHASGLRIGDLRPHHVFLTEEGLRILVEGDGRRFADEARLTRTGCVIGTPYYDAPEDLVGRPSDARADLYSLGAIYYHLLTGRPPQAGARSLFELIRDRLEGRLDEPSAPEVGPGERRVLARLLAVDPGERYPDAGGVLSDLIQLAEGLPVRPDDPPWREVVVGPESRSRRGARALALLGLVAALLAWVAYALLRS